ncbi:ANKRD50 [Symbiodinium sp. KB8]|nr:ANKRD50 [Symbiodinium sp. KB8]
MPDIKSLADLLLGSGDGRFIGEQIVYRCLMVAGPGTGKTWSSCQLMYHLSKDCSDAAPVDLWAGSREPVQFLAQYKDTNFRVAARPAGAPPGRIVKVPVLIFAQKLAGMIRGHQMNDKIYAEMPLSERDALLDKPWLEDAFRMECGKEYADVLLRALKLRSAIVILDGIDEASDVKGIMQDFVMKRLVAMQISVVLTSRPEGVSAALSTLTQSFAVMSLRMLMATRRSTL